MKRAAIVLLVVPLIALWLYGCDQASNPLETDAVDAAGQTPLLAVTKVAVCHRDGQGNYSVISISDNAYDSHIAHGDRGADGLGGCSEEPPPPTSCDLIQFEPFAGPGYLNYPINGETDSNQYRSFLQDDLVAAVKTATAAVAGDAPSGWPGNGGVIGLGDMSEADGSIPGTSIGSPGHPAGTHENGVDIDFAYFQTGTDNNRLRYICTALDAAYNCASPPVYLDAMRTALLIARLAENPRLRVIGLDALARVEIEAALDQLVSDGLVDSALRASIPLASGADFGWTFMSAFMHVSYTDLCPPTGPDAGIAVRLTWDTPGDSDQTDNIGTDLDLHFLQPTYVLGSANDCYSGSQNPDWGIPGLDGDPALDIDDADGQGPETITVDTPTEGVTYKAAVEYVGDRGFGPSYVTVQVFIESVLVAETANVEMVAGEVRQFFEIDWPSGAVRTAP